MFYKLAKYPFNLTWNLIFILVTVTLWRIAPPSSLKTAFKLLTTTTVRHNPNSNRYETFMQLIKTTRYSYFRWRTLKGSWGRWQKIPYFWRVVIEVRANSKTKGLERGRKRRARLWRDARTLRGSDTLTLQRLSFFVRFKKRWLRWRIKRMTLSKMLVVKKKKEMLLHTKILKTGWDIFTLNVW